MIAREMLTGLLLDKKDWQKILLRFLFYFILFYFVLFFLLKAYKQLQLLIKCPCQIINNLFATTVCNLADLYFMS